MDDTEETCSMIMRKMISNEHEDCVNIGRQTSIDSEEFELFPDLIDLVDGRGITEDVNAIDSRSPISLRKEVGPANKSMPMHTSAKYANQDKVSSLSASGVKRQESVDKMSRIPTSKHVLNSADTPPTVIKLKMSSNQEQQFLKYITTLSPSDVALDIAADRRQRQDSVLSGVGVEKFVEKREALSNEGGNENSMLSMSKNAIAARENRQKKKAYVTKLQSTVKNLSFENCSLKSNVTKLQECVNKLESEVKYLKNVIANQGTLAALLKNTLKTPGVQFVSCGLTDEDQSTVKTKNKQSRANKHDKRKYEYASDSDSESDTPAAARGNGQKYLKTDHPYATGTKGAQKYLEAKSLSPSSSCEKIEKAYFKTEKSADSRGGICMHVSGNTVSLELCAQCNNCASKNAVMHDGENQVKV